MHEVNDKKHKSMASSPLLLCDKLGNGLCGVGMVGMRHGEDIKVCEHCSLLVYSLSLAIALQ